MPKEIENKTSFSGAYKEAREILSEGGLRKPSLKKKKEGPGLAKEEKEETRIHKAFNRQVNDFRLSLIKCSFITDGKINSNGRVFFKVMTFLLSLIYLVTDTNLIEVMTYISLMSIVLPILVDIVTRFIVSKQEIEETNLYDMMYAFGLYIISLAPFVALGVFALKKLKKTVPGIYESFSGFPLYVCLLAVFLLALDIVFTLIAKHKEKTSKKP